MMFRTRLLLAIVFFFQLSDTPSKPQKIVSINLCTDQLLMMLAEPERIASVSYLAARADISVMAQQAAGIRQNHGLAEEILMMKPDLILAGTFTSKPTVFMLKRLGYPVLEVPVAYSFADIRRNLRMVAAAMGEKQRGELLIKDFDRRLARLFVGQLKNRPVAVYYRENSYTTGGDTLVNAILNAAGFQNLAAKLGITGSGRLPLETLVTRHSDVIILGRRRGPGGSVASAVFLHPAFRDFAATRLSVHIDEPLWICGTPYVLDAVDQMVSVRQQWARRKSVIERESLP